MQKRLGKRSSGGSNAKARQNANDVTQKPKPKDGDYIVLDVFIGQDNDSEDVDGFNTVKKSCRRASAVP